MNSSSKLSATPSDVKDFPYTEAYPAVPSTGNKSSGVFSVRADEELAHREAAAREEGYQQGEAKARARYEEELQRARDALGEALRGLVRDRDIYYQRIEAEVVQLALAIARKVIYREAQIDPMLLAGMVKVVFEKLKANTEVRIAVHPSQVDSWQEYFSGHPPSHEQLIISADPNLTIHQCTVQTSLGTTQLGTDIQLKEIERGLLDLLAQRPVEITSQHG